MMEEAGLIDILSLNPTLKKDIRYASADNFTGRVLYRTAFSLYAEPKLAEGIARAQEALQRLYPGYSIVIFDAARPLSVQREMYDIVRGTDWEPYIANPYAEGGAGFHNYGMAVDLSIADDKGSLLDMGSGFDSFTTLSHVGNERTLLLEGKITPEAYANRMLLFALMGREGLLPHKFEWWHFQYYQLDEDKRNFMLLDF